jgi:hypothetical protein
MKIQYPIFLAIVLQLLTQTVALAGSDLCYPREVAVVLYDADHDAKFEYGYHEPSHENCEQYWYPIKTVEDIGKSLVDIRNKDLKIKYLTIRTEFPDIGKLAYGDKQSSLSVVTEPMLLGAYADVIASDARIVFSGEKIGRGCRGEDFIAAVALNLLYKGGTVTANAHYLGIDQVLTVSPTKANPFSWKRKPVSSEECVGNIQKELTKLDRIRSVVSNCNRYTKTDKEALDQLISDLLRTKGEYAARVVDDELGRRLTSNKFRDAARDLFTAFERIPGVLARFSEYDNCLPPDEIPTGTIDW